MLCADSGALGADVSGTDLFKAFPSAACPQAYLASVAKPPRIRITRPEGPADLAQSMKLWGPRSGLAPEKRRSGLAPEKRRSGLGAEKQRSGLAPQ
jgi:hypothetical protein